MNDPNKRINVNLSSLLSLKAELIRKQAEVSQTKATRNKSEEYSAKKSNHSSRKRDKQQQPNETEPKKKEDIEIYVDDSLLLEKSRRVLEAKSKFYDRMTRTGGKLNSDDNYLVLFNRKQQDERDKPKEFIESSDSDVSLSDEEASKDDDNEDWVEYVDCLGRTRKCLKEDLEDAKRRDAELAASMPERLDQSKANWMIDTKGSLSNDGIEKDTVGPFPPESVFNDGLSLMSKHDEQRVNWERKEQENLEKIDVHYQDVFFDEARQHGVGYYAYSTDEEERRRQQKELNDARKKTIAEQERHEAIRLQRDKMIAERVLAAKNRQRARLGLPPLTPEEENAQKANSEEQKETKEERKERKRAEKLERRKKREEAEREQQRQEHVRPWDKEKGSGMPSSSNNNQGSKTEAGDPKWTYKPERLPMSQDEWNEQKRAERNPEFAPTTEPSQYLKNKRTTFTMPPPPVPTISSQQYCTIPSPMDDGFSSFQTSKKQIKTFQRRNYETYHQPNEQAPPRRGAEIPPPDFLTVDSFLPSHSKRSRSNNELEQSVEAGLRFLREHSDKGVASTKSSWTAKADY